MNNDLVWRFDVMVIQWLIVLAILVIVVIISAVVTRRSLRAFREQSYQPDDRTSAPGRWHTESAEAVNTLVAFEIFYLFNSRHIEDSVFNWAGLTGNRYVLITIAVLVILQLGFTYLGPMQSLFGTTGINFSIWLRILLVASSVLILVEMEKYFVRRAKRIK